LLEVAMHELWKSVFVVQFSTRRLCLLLFWATIQRLEYEASYPQLLRLTPWPTCRYARAPPFNYSLSLQTPSMKTFFSPSFRCTPLKVVL
jgi:hypothetical protein